MIKFKATGPDGRQLVGFGLSAGNVARLQAGEPILIPAADIDLPFDVVILYGETEEAILEEMRENGVDLPPADARKPA